MDTSDNTPPGCVGCLPWQIHAALGKVALLDAIPGIQHPLAGVAFAKFAHFHVREHEEPFGGVVGPFNDGEIEYVAEFVEAAEAGVPGIEVRRGAGNGTLDARGSVYASTRSEAPPPVSG